VKAFRCSTKFWSSCNGFKRFNNK